MVRREEARFFLVLPSQPWDTCCSIFIVLVPANASEVTGPTLMDMQSNSRKTSQLVVNDDGLCMMTTFVWWPPLYDHNFCMKTTFVWWQLLYDENFCTMPTFEWWQLLYDDNIRRITTFHMMTTFVWWQPLYDDNLRMMTTFVWWPP